MNRKKIKTVKKTLNLELKSRKISKIGRKSHIQNSFENQSQVRRVILSWNHEWLLTSLSRELHKNMNATIHGPFRIPIFNLPKNLRLTRTQVFH